MVKDLLFSDSTMRSATYSFQQQQQPSTDKIRFNMFATAMLVRGSLRSVLILLFLWFVLVSLFLFLFVVSVASSALC